MTQADILQGKRTLQQIRREFAEHEIVSVRIWAGDIEFGIAGSLDAYNPKTLIVSERKDNYLLVPKNQPVFSVNRHKNPPEILIIL